MSTRDDKHVSQNLPYQKHHKSTSTTTRTLTSPYPRNTNTTTYFLHRRFSKQEAPAHIKGAHTVNEHERFKTESKHTTTSEA